jgi:hypothetical protein
MLTHLDDQLRSAVTSRVEDDYSDHERTYRRFAWAVFLFSAHVLIILALIAYLLV